MANEWHVKWLAEGVSKWNLRRKRVDFLPNLSGIRIFDHLPKDFRDEPKTSRTFERIDLSKANLERSDLSDLNFSGANFNGANLNGADLSKSNFENANFIRATLIDANGTRALFNGASFDNSNLTGLQLDFAEVHFARFEQTDISDEQREAIANQEILENERIFPTLYSHQTRADITQENSLIGTAIDENDTRTKKAKYDVYYGTTRQPIYERGELISFDGDTAQEISLGMCEVIVPAGRSIYSDGGIGSRLWKVLINKKEPKLTRESIIPLNQEIFWDHLIKTADKMKVKARPTIFIHGYNTSFDDAVLRAAQIGLGLGIGQGIGLFSWASKGAKTSYSADETTVEKSKYALSSFIEDYIENSGGLGVNIIAHSMGCRCLLGALERLGATNPTALHDVHQVILAAADVDTGIMPHLAPFSTKNAERTTSYVSSRDKALKLSTWLHSFPRVGVSPPTYLLKGIDTVLVSELRPDDFISHAYVAENRTILSDMYSILKHDAPPQERHGLKMIAKTDGNTYWKVVK